MSNTPDLSNLPKPLRKLLKAAIKSSATFEVVKLGPCGDTECESCNEAKTGKGTVIGTADASKAQAQGTVGVDLASSSDSATAFAYAAAAHKETALREEASTLTKLGEISVQARAHTVKDIGEFLRQQIRSIQRTLSDIEFDGIQPPDGKVEHLQARINHLRNFKALFEIYAASGAQLGGSTSWSN